MSRTMPRTIAQTLVVAALLTPLAGVAALAHHGWSWAEGAQTTLEGTIKTVSVAPPHPQFTVTASDGKVWQVDLGNPNQTANSGFTAQSAKPGDTVTVLGNRSKEPGKPHMKAVRITISGKNYDMYPERIGTN